MVIGLHGHQDGIRAPAEGDQILLVQLAALFQ